MKYLNTEVTFREFPDEISLCINLSNCRFQCEGCHSPELWENNGTELTQSELGKLIDSNTGITCVGFMGGKPDVVNTLAQYIKENYPNLRIGWYWGGTSIPSEIKILNFDYIKIGPYIKEKGGLDNPNTNQVFYAKGKYLNKLDASPNSLYDVTYKFWNNEENSHFA